VDNHAVGLNPLGEAFGPVQEGRRLREKLKAGAVADLKFVTRFLSAPIRVLP
jgi:hypothetical protein